MSIFRPLRSGQREQTTDSTVFVFAVHLGRIVLSVSFSLAVARRAILRTGLWTKHRINLGQEFVIGGYTPGTHGFDALIVGFYRGRELIYVARVRAGLVPVTRRSVFEKIKHLKAAKCPFANLPELSDGRWGAGLTAEKMKECVWLLCRMRHRIHNVECRTMPN
jgi:hypothetical protein